MDRLPRELLDKVICYVDRRDLLSMSLVCRAWRGFSTDELWARIVSLRGAAHVLELRRLSGKPAPLLQLERAMHYPECGIPRHIRGTIMVDELRDHRGHLARVLDHFLSMRGLVLIGISLDKYTDADRDMVLLRRGRVREHLRLQGVIFSALSHFEQLLLNNPEVTRLGLGSINVSRGLEPAPSAIEWHHPGDDNDADDSSSSPVPPLLLPNLVHLDLFARPMSRMHDRLHAWTRRTTLGRKPLSPAYSVILPRIARGLAARRAPHLRLRRLLVAGLDSTGDYLGGDADRAARRAAGDAAALAALCAGSLEALALADPWNGASPDRGYLAMRGLLFPPPPGPEGQEGTELELKRLASLSLDDSDLLRRFWVLHHERHERRHLFSGRRTSPAPPAPPLLPRTLRTLVLNRTRPLPDHEWLSPDNLDRNYKVSEIGTQWHEIDGYLAGDALPALERVVLLIISGAFSYFPGGATQRPDSKWLDGWEETSRWFARICLPLCNKKGMVQVVRLDHMNWPEERLSWIMSPFADLVPGF